MLLNLETKFYYSLNETGVFIWKRIDGRSGMDKLAHSLQGAYDVSFARAIQSAERFVKLLRSLRLVLQLLFIVGAASFLSCGRGAQEPAWKREPISLCSHRIAFASTGDGHARSIYTMKEDGSGKKRLTFPGDYSADGQPAWSPSGDRIVFTRTYNLVNNIYIMDSEGSGITHITTGEENSSDPGFSCDGTKIIYTFRDQIWIMNADGGNKIPLTTIDDTPYGAGGARWSPDCSRIAYISDPSCFHRRRQPPVRPADYSSLWVMDSDGGNKRPVLCGGKPIKICYLPISWSCDGKALLFFTWVGKPLYIYSIFKVNIEDCKEAVPLTPDSLSAEDPSWNPSCERFAFRCEFGDGLHKICSIGLRGEGLKILTPEFLESERPAMSLCFQ